MKRILLKLSHRRIDVSWLVGWLIVLPMIIPFVHNPLFKAHDYTHVARLAELDLTIRDGFMPPRWSENLGFGYGMPLFSFYAPLPYYLGVLFHVFGISYMLAVKLLFVLTFYLSFVGMYHLAKKFWSSGAAYVSAMLFVYVPYRAVDVYVRGALGELWGILFIVLALNFMVKLIDGYRLKWLVLTTVALTGVWLSHNLMALVGIPIVVLFGLGYGFRNQTNRVKTLLVVVLSFLWSIGIASYFILPAFLEKSHTSVEQLTMGGGNYSQHFVYLKQMINSPFNYGGSIEGPHDGISFEIGKIQLLFLSIAIFVLALKWRAINLKQKFVMISGLLGLGLSVYLMSFHSEFWWSAIPLIKYLQFPWRLLMVPMIVIPLISGVASEALLAQKSHISKICLIFIVIAVFYVPFFKPDPKQPDDWEVYSTDSSYMQNVMSKVIPDYIHPNMSQLVLSSEKNIKVPTERFAISGNEDVRMEVVQNKSQSFILSLTGEGVATVSANIFDFPGWQWYVNEATVKHEVGQGLPIMSVTVDLVAGDIKVVAGKLTETRLRKVADWISIISISLIGLVYVINRKRA